MEVTSADVVWCYRNILGREPEVVGSHWTPRGRRRRSPIANFSLHTAGVFVDKRVSAPALVPLDAPTMRVDLDAAPSQLSALRDRIGKVWVHLGEACPTTPFLLIRTYSRITLDQEFSRPFLEER